MLTINHKFLSKYKKLTLKLGKFPTETEMKLAGFTKIEEWSKNQKAVISYFEKNEPSFLKDLQEKQDSLSVIRETQKGEVVKSFIRLANKLNRFPTISEMADFGVNRNTIRSHFVNTQNLKKYVVENYSDLLNNVFDSNDLLNPERLKKTEMNIKTFNRFIISSVTEGNLSHGGKYLKSMYNYAKVNKARILLIVTKMNINEIDRNILQDYLDEKLDIIFTDTKIHKHLHINTIKIDAKVVNPTAGIQRYQKDETSFIYASPKQTCKSVPIKKKSLPRILMSPGAITQTDYIRDKFNKRKRDVMADNDHLIGAIIVEIDGDVYYTRPTQATKEGNFIDLGKEYTHTGKVKENAPIAFVMGDLHSAQKCEKTFKLWLDLVKKLKIPNVIMHDTFDCMSLNPHERNKKTLRDALELEDKSTLSDELKLLVEDLKETRKHTKKVYIVDSNHDDMLKRAFDSGQIWEDPRNSFLGSLLHPYAIVDNIKDDYTEKEILNILVERTGIPKESLLKNYPEIIKRKSLLEYATHIMGLDSKKENIEWLDVTDSLVLGGFELADHGHKGAHGAKGSFVSAARSFLKRITGHTHVEEQMNYLVSVGHTSLDPKYARGGQSGWTRTSAIIYKSGQVQTIREVKSKLFKK